MPRLALALASPLVLLILLFSAAAQAKAAVPALRGLRMLDVDGAVQTIGADQAKATVVVFVGADCPISNRYVPYLNDLAKLQRPLGVDVFAVISDPALTRKAAIEHRDLFKITCPLVFDASGELARLLAPTHTPEAFILGPDRTVRYRGRIDDAFADLGKPAQVTKSHDLEDALRAVLAGQIVPTPRTQPVGCLFEAWEQKSSATMKPTYARHIAPILAV